MSKASVPRGMRDFAAATVYKRNFILNTIRSVFELYGFEPLETPAMENLETLMGKYGEEGDKLIFKVLNNGLNDPKNIDKAKAGFEDILSGKSTADLTERALKYDLTIPFARYVAMNAGQINFPYKRYQIQPVWRADRPQRGRYREFTQCDADVVGSRSLLNEVELCHIYHTSFAKLGLESYELKINSRKILAALAETTAGPDKLTDITTAIDKLDKIGLEKVKEELAQRGLGNDDIEKIGTYLNVTGDNNQKLIAVAEQIGQTETGKKGIEELEFVISKSGDINLTVDFTLARGLNYYTGIILEASGPSSVKMGSIGGGGRYDDLTGLFGVKDIPGAGISFGIDRIYDVMEELSLFPEDAESKTKALFFNLGENESEAARTLVQQLRNENIACELYPDQVKLDKQFRYAEAKKIAYVVIIGSRELESQTCSIKELKSGVQETVSFTGLKNFFSEKY